MIAMRYFWFILALFPLSVQANGIERLKEFFQSTTSMRALFHQTVLDSKGRKVQEVNGSMQLQRPGKFHWDYYKPYLQLIVGDGEKVWLYDPELNQVSVRTLDKALGSSPAALLAGDKEIEKTFVLKNEGLQDGLEWVSATPKNTESGFERVLLGFKESQLQEMELHDNFGHITVIEFSKLERNPKLEPQSFHFVPPAGADVVGE
jgi:outer membrane lipoprotein carrier protein